MTFARHSIWGHVLHSCECFTHMINFIIYYWLRYVPGHPPSRLHTQRLKSQHHEIITTFPNSTPRYGFALGGGVHIPLSSPALRFIPLGFLHSGLMDFVFV